MKKLSLALCLACAVSTSAQAFFGLFKSGYKDGVWDGEYQASDGANTRVVLTSENEEDHYRYILEVSSSGDSYIQVQSRQRDFIRYSGRMDL